MLSAQRTAPRRIQATAQSIPVYKSYPRLAFFKTRMCTPIKPQHVKVRWNMPRFMPFASSLTAAALFAKPYKTYAQAKKDTSLVQTMPAASLWHAIAQGNTLNRYTMVQLFINDCALHAHENNAIPTHTINNDTVRLATYNVHMWKDAHSKNNFDAIIDTIGKVNADVLVLQEVLMFDNDRIVKKLKELGYTYTATAQAATFGGKLFGNMVVSKYPFASDPVIKTYDADQKYAGERRCYIKAQVQLPGDKKITVYGTHLDVYDQTETLRKREIEELVTDSARSQIPCIIAADFNAVRKRDYQYEVNGKSVWDMLNESNKKRTGMPTQTRALETLESQNFVDSFTSNNQQNPRATVWSGTAVDFLYLNQAWQQPNADFNVGKSHVYYSSASDHLPILMDVNIKK